MMIKILVSKKGPEEIPPVPETPWCSRKI